MGDSSDAEQRVRHFLGFVDRGVLSVDEAAAEIANDARDAVPYLGHPDCARRLNDRIVLLIDACSRATAVSPSAGPVEVELRAYRSGWNDWYDRWTGRRAALRGFVRWDDPLLAAEIVTRLCDEAVPDGDDRFIETVARIANKHGSVPAVAAIVPLDDPERYRIGAHHGSVAAIRMLRVLADEGSDEARIHLGRLATVAEWTAWPFDGQPRSL